MSDSNQKSWYAKILGRSIFSVIFGKFFEIKNNTAGIIATALVLTLCYIVIAKIDLVEDMNVVVDGILNVIFVVVGYYFGAKQSTISKDEDA
ncbi:hypothetical protein [Poseidonibacter lekithochrous]|uniref:hypothetical protein n=1 Tax=Poseidonibacter lekithochrous TaxID=1904463 RepID=UPI000D38C2D2|nr:hypothetical protein [Poseidonibacter lekithochrous]